MRHFTRKKQYKAKDPYETITLIRNILADCDIFVSESSRYEDVSDVASCRIWLSDPELIAAGFGTNGKGMTARYSLASAYGEFMERLQNFQLFGDYGENAFLHGLTKYRVAPDEVMLDPKEVIEVCGGILEKIMKKSRSELLKGAEGIREQIACVPYYDVFGKRTVLLPHKTLRMVTGSNGMAAGNTYMEAVTQGLSEIYERAAVMECYRDDPEIRLIDPEYFRGNLIFDRLERMRMFGFDYRILDLSMGRGYPVLGLRLEINGSVGFKAGADPCPVTALERCLTEMFQGSQEENGRLFKKDCCGSFTRAGERERMMISDEEIAYHVDGSGRIACSLFNPSNTFCGDHEGTDGESEEADYSYLVNLTNKLGYGLYIRDWSFLGFPTYHIVVPELSNYDLVYENGDEVFAWSFESLPFRKDRCTEGCAKILNRLYEKYENRIPSQIPDQERLDHGYEIP